MTGTLILSLFVVCFAVVHGNIEAALKNAKAIVNAELNSIRKEWQVDEYPNFLKSCQMHKSSWEIMKLRFMEAIAKGVDNVKSKKVNFLIAFTGSSVAAGHDSMIKYSYPLVVGDMMRPAFAAVGINLTTTNNAIANNP